MSTETTTATSSSPSAAPAPPAQAGAGRHAALVAAGIFLSRIAGLVRQRVFAHYLGSGAVAGVFNAALRIPNLLQNLLGEGVLSSSFIPVYANLLARGEEEEADRVAGAVGGLLAAATAVLVAAGMLATPFIVQVITPGLSGGDHALAVRLVRVLFPATGTLVLSAWCLGVLNSHRRFFLSYAAPVVLNGAVIVALALAGWAVRGDPGGRLAQETRMAGWVAWGYVAGAIAQVAVQVPTALALLGPAFRPSLDAARASVRTVLHNFAPALVGRGVVQLSAFLDTVYASYVGTRGLAALGYQQILYLLPISLFGMAISASELPAMSSAVGSAEAVAAQLRARLGAGLPAPGRRGRRRLLPDRAAERRRHAVPVAGADGLDRGDAGRHHGPPLRLRLLRAQGHAHPALVRAGAPGAHSRACLVVGGTDAGRAGGAARGRA